MNRRMVLRGSGVAFTATLAGCSSNETDAGAGGTDGKPETVVDETIAIPSNYSVDAEPKDVLRFEVTARAGNATVRVVTADDTVESIHRETVETDASFTVAIEDPGAYEIRAVPRGETQLRAEIVRSA
ncbi:hypothetical protein HYG81_08265 [Natrinema zhouii]|uniref:Uncharacterized protein n=1 Tax=Natrinema zhouii TaxID=1710539 RepID=A0A7D6GTB7_9EURY|nr:hypothetical protein [Natrinema zhouii]QLK27583.1 hypothetical protein HYG81_08265 [Natrinema zhouii]